MANVLLTVCFVPLLGGFWVVCFDFLFLGGLAGFWLVWVVFGWFGWFLAGLIQGGWKKYSLKIYRVFIKKCTLFECSVLKHQEPNVTMCYLHESQSM